MLPVTRKKSYNEISIASWHVVWTNPQLGTFFFSRALNTFLYLPSFCVNSWFKLIFTPFFIVVVFYRNFSLLVFPEALASGNVLVIFETKERRIMLDFIKIELTCCKCFPLTHSLFTVTFQHYFTFSTVFYFIFPISWHLYSAILIFHFIFSS